MYRCPSTTTDPVHTKGSQVWGVLDSELPVVVHWTIPLSTPTPLKSFEITVTH